MKKVLALILIFSFAISCGGISMVGGPLVPKPKKTNVIFALYGGKDEDNTSSINVNIFYKEDYFSDYVKEDVYKPKAKYGDYISYIPIELEKAYGTFYPGTKIALEIIPSVAHRVKAVYSGGVELMIAKDYKMYIELDEYIGQYNWSNHYIQIVFEIKDEYLVEPTIVGDEYQVSSAKQLRWIASRAQRGETFENKTIKLINDIDLENKDFTGIVSGPIVRNFFEGTFDGNNKKIVGLKMEHDIDDRVYRVGFIGNLGTNGVVKNLAIQSGSIKNSSDGAAIVGKNYGLVEQVENNATVKGTMRMGGIVGYNLGSVINATNKGAIFGDYFTAGIVGYNYKGSIKNSENNATITGHSQIGKVVGYYEATDTIEGNVENGSLVEGVYTFD